MSELPVELFCMPDGTLRELGPEYCSGCRRPLDGPLDGPWGTMVLPGRGKFHLRCRPDDFLEPSPEPKADQPLVYDRAAIEAERAAIAEADSIADEVRTHWLAHERRFVGTGLVRLDLSVDDAIKHVARERSLDWRVVLEAYRAKYPRKGRPRLRAVQS